MATQSELRISDTYVNYMTVQKPDSAMSDDLTGTRPIVSRKTIFTKDYVNKMLNRSGETPEFLPRGARYIQKFTTGYSILIEEPPAMRTIFVRRGMQDEVSRARGKKALDLYDPDKKYRNGRTEHDERGDSYYSFNLAMPYVLHFLTFSSEYQFYGGSVFFRKAQMRGLGDELYKAPLCNINDSQHICYGSGEHSNRRPSLSLAVESVLNSWWGSAFNSDYTYNYNEYVKAGIEGLTSYMEWQYYSKTNPLFIYDVPWIKFKRNVEEQLNEIQRSYHGRRSSQDRHFTTLVDVLSQPLLTTTSVDEGKRVKRSYTIVNDMCQAHNVTYRGEPYAIEVGSEFTNNKGERLIIDSFNGIPKLKKVKTIQIDRNGKPETWKATRKVINYIVRSHQAANYEDGIEINGVKLKTGDIISLDDPIYKRKTYRKVGLIRKSRNDQAQFEVQLSGQYYYDNCIENVEILKLDKPVIAGIEIKKGESYIYVPNESGTTINGLLSCHDYKFQAADISSNGEVIFRFQDTRGGRRTIRSNRQIWLMEKDAVRPLVKDKVFYINTRLYAKISNLDSETIFSYKGSVLFDSNETGVRVFNEKYFTYTDSIIKKDKFFIDGPEPQEFKIGDNVVLADYTNPVETLRVKTITSFIRNSENGNIDFVLSDKEGNMHRHTYIDVQRNIIHTGTIRKIVASANRITSGTKIVAKTSDIQPFKKGSVNIIVGFIIDTGGEPMALCSNCATLWLTDLMDTNKFERYTMNHKKWEAMEHDPIDMSTIEPQTGDVLIGDGVHVSSTQYHVVYVDGYARKRVIPRDNFIATGNYPDSYTLDKYFLSNTTFYGIPAPRVNSSEDMFKGSVNGFGLVYEHEHSPFYYNSNLRRS